MERFRDRVQGQLEFQAILEPSLSAERTEALVETLRQEGAWEDVRVIAPQEHFRNIQGLEDWMSDEANKDIVAAMSRSAPPETARGRCVSPIKRWKRPSRSRRMRKYAKFSPTRTRSDAFTSILSSGKTARSFWNGFLECFAS